MNHRTRIRVSSLGSIKSVSFEEIQRGEFFVVQSKTEEDDYLKHYIGELLEFKTWIRLCFLFFSASFIQNIYLSTDKKCTLEFKKMISWKKYVGLSWVLQNENKTRKLQYVLIYIYIYFQIEIFNHFKLFLMFLGYVSSSK